MSTEALIPDPALLSYALTRTGATVRGAHAINAATSANVCALGRPAKIAVVQGLGGSNTVHVGYVRSHASIKVLAVAWYYYPDPDVFSTTNRTIDVKMTLSDAAANTITSPSTRIPRGLDGTAITAMHGYVSLGDESFLGAIGYFDLDDVATVLTDTSWDLKFEWTRSGGDVSLMRVELWECPRSAVNDADVHGALTGPLNPGNPILAGTVSTRGYERIARTIEGAVACNRALLNATWPADTTAGIPRTGSATFTAFTGMLEGGTTPWPWRIRPWVVYDPNSASGEEARVRYFYQVTGGGTAAVRINTGATASPFDTTGLTSATWAWSVWKTVRLPTNGTGRIATVTFEGKTTAGTLYVAGIQLESVT